MKRKQIRFLGYCLAALVIALTLDMGACSPKAKLTSIAITPAQPYNLHEASTQQFKASGTYSDGSTADITSGVTWASSDRSVATISITGLATGLAAGNTEITSSLSGISSNVVTLTVVKLTAIAIRQSSPFSLTVNSTQQFTATGTYSDGATEDVTLTGTWKSSAPIVAAITPAGHVTANAPGNTDITISFSGVISPALTLTVTLPDTSPKLSSVTISRSVVTDLKVGSSQQLTATALYTDGNTIDVTSQATWVSSDPSICTVSSSGLVTGKAPGKSNITAFFSGVTSDPHFTLTVISP